MLNAYDIIETIKMIDEEHLDIRTVTMGISLVDCIRGDINETARLVYDKVTRCAEKLVPTAQGIEAEFGIPIVNKRVSVTPISVLGGAVDKEDLTPSLSLCKRRLILWVSTSSAAFPLSLRRALPRETSVL